MPIKVIMTSRELDPQFQDPNDKAKGISSLKRAKNRGKKFSFLHKGIINNNAITLELVTN